MDARVRHLAEVAVSATRGCAMCGSPFLEPGTEACDEWGLCLPCWRRLVGAAGEQAARESEVVAERRRRYNSVRQSILRYGVRAADLDLFIAATGGDAGMETCPMCGFGRPSDERIAAMEEIRDSFTDEGAYRRVIAALAENGIGEQRAREWAAERARESRKGGRESLWRG